MGSTEIAVNGVGGISAEFAVDAVVSVGAAVFIGAHEDIIKAMSITMVIDLVIIFPLLRKEQPNDLRHENVLDWDAVNAFSGTIASSGDAFW